jgi:hypothetical protein
MTMLTLGSEISLYQDLNSYLQSPVAIEEFHTALAHDPDIAALRTAIPQFKTSTSVMYLPSIPRNNSDLWTALNQQATHNGNTLKNCRELDSAIYEELRCGKENSIEYFMQVCYPGQNDQQMSFGVSFGKIIGQFYKDWCKGSAAVLADRVSKSYQNLHDGSDIVTGSTNITTLVSMDVLRYSASQVLAGQVRKPATVTANANIGKGKIIELISMND